MSRFAFELATPADDDQLVELLSATPMEGRVSISLARRPSYFAASEIDGRTVQVGVARDRASGRIVGMGSRSIGIKYVDGERMPVGYLSGLRLLPEYRGQAGLLARGYRFLRKLHTDESAGFYLTTIAADNTVALNLLTSGRVGLPVYHQHGTYHTLALSTAQSKLNGASLGTFPQIRPALPNDRDAILDFLNEQGRSRAFFPAYEKQDLFTGKGLLKGLNCEDLWLAICDDEIVGTLACWDQRAFKQIVVHSYHGWLRLMRSLYNV